MRSTQLPFPVRVAAAVAMVVGPVVLGAALLLLLLVLDLTTLRHPGLLTVVCWVLTAALGTALWRTRPWQRLPQTDPYGVRVERYQEARLWALLDEVARATGTRAPDELWVVPEANAGTSEQLPRRVEPPRRRLLLGAPLLVGLTEGELRAVLGHELAHDSGQDTRLSPLVYRGSRAMVHLIAATKDRDVLGGIVRGYGTACLRVAGEVNRRQELAADALAAELAGTAPMVSALEKLQSLERSWTYFRQTYLVPGAAAGCVPAGVLSLFERLVVTPQPEGHPLAAPLVPSAEAAGPYDTHPPTLARVAELRRAARPERPGQDGPAAALLENPADLATRFDALATEGGALQLVTWQDFAARVPARSASASAGLLVGAVERQTGRRPAGLADVLSEALRDPVALGVEALGDDAPADPEERETAAREVLQAGLWAHVASGLVAAGAVRWEASLEGRPYRVVTDNGSVDLDGLLRDALASPEGMQLFGKRLLALGVDPRHRVEPPAAPSGMPALQTSHA